MDYVTLNNGVQMPVIGYGTYQTPPSITERRVSDALRIGYRSIDTAQCYGNEREVGLACRKFGIPRSELFITTKLWACHGYHDTLRSIEGSLKAVLIKTGHQICWRITLFAERKKADTQSARSMQQEPLCIPAWAVMFAA